MTTVAPGDAEAPIIRQAEQADLLAVHQIEQAAFPQPWPFSAFEQYLGERGFLVADAGAVVGYIVADTVPNHGRPLGHIKDVAVREDQRGKGYGSALLRRALGVLSAAGASDAKLEVRAGNEGAKRLYEDFGFVHRRTIPRYYADGEDAHVLLCQLS